MLGSNWSIQIAVKFFADQAFSDFLSIFFVNFFPFRIYSCFLYNPSPWWFSSIQTQTNHAPTWQSLVNLEIGQLILLKLDFQKAFDCVAWPFLFDTLASRGSPQQFITWIKLLFSSSTSAIVVNYFVGPVFQHKRGLRQGTLYLQFYLYWLGGDVLCKIIESTSLSVHLEITHKLRDLFQLSTESVVQWYDKWGGTRLFFFGSDSEVPKKRYCTLAAALPIWHQLLPAPPTLGQAELFDRANQLQLYNGYDEIVGDGQKMVFTWRLLSIYH